jgi:cobalt-zinc-cadmium efflux system protein
MGAHHHHAGHGHGHAHEHGHAHGHVHAQDAGGAGDPHDQHAVGGGRKMRAFRVSIGLNAALVAAQLAAGLWLGSVALVADAVHNAMDVLGLVLAWFAARLALRRPDARHTYGMARSTILAAMANAGLVLAACGALAWESLGRLLEPHPAPPGLWVMGVAAVALVVNAVSAALFWRGSHADLNERGAFLHLAGDAAVSLGVVVAGLGLWLTGWAWLDPATGLAIALVVAWSGYQLLRESLDLALDAVPRGIDLAAIRAALLAEDGVLGVHDLHVWPLSTTVTALTVHLEHDGRRDADRLLAAVHDLLAARFGIRHTTVQLELVACGRRC